MKRQRLPKGRIEILEYEKEERIIAMDEKMTCLLFIVRGTIHIYGVEPDGTQYSIVAAQEETFLAWWSFYWTGLHLTSRKPRRSYGRFLFRFLPP